MNPKKIIDQEGNEIAGSTTGRFHSGDPAFNRPPRPGPSVDFANIDFAALEERVILIHASQMMGKSAMRGAVVFSHHVRGGPGVADRTIYSFDNARPFYGEPFFDIPPKGRRPADCKCEVELLPSPVLPRGIKGPAKNRHLDGVLERQHRNFLSPKKGRR